jgi:glycosyltransferase involved in cell wall biosynthesis
MSFFSIIVPVYNVEDWIGRCLDSILADRCTDMELILVDDGSTDRSGGICDRYAASHTNVKVIHKENGGLASARNAGIEAASGEWVAFIDSDDWVDRDCFDRVRELLARLEGEELDIVKFGFRRISGDESREFLPCVPEGAYDRGRVLSELLPVAFGSGRISDSTIHTFILSACAHIYRRDLLTRTGIRFVSEREVGSEDFLFLYSLFIRASGVYVTHSVWYNYEMREGSLTGKYREGLYEQYRCLGSLVLRELEKEGLDAALSDDFRVFYSGLMYICIINECIRRGSRRAQTARVRELLKDRDLKAYVRELSFSDTKSRILAGCMRIGAALPLCMIQWNKTGKIL